MALYLDSADAGDARRAARLGFLAGVTTNPARVRRAGGPAEQVVAELCSVVQGTVFYQVTSPPGVSLEVEMERLRRVKERAAF